MPISIFNLLLSFLIVKWSGQGTYSGNAGEEPVNYNVKFKKTF